MLKVRILIFSFEINPYFCFTNDLRIMATVSWVVMKHHKKADGTYNIKIRITHNRTTAYLATEIYTDMVRFKKGSSSGIITDGDIEDEVNAKVKEIRKIINLSQEIVSCLETAKDVISFIESRKQTSKDIDFFEYADKIIQNTDRSGTKYIRENAVMVFSRFLGKRELPFNMFTGKLLRAFDAWLRTERVYITERTKIAHTVKPASDSGVRLYMTTLKSIFYKALNEYNDYDIGNIIIANNPFRSYKVPHENVAMKKAVSVETIKTIRDYKSTNKKNRQVTLARDMFMLSFYLAGINMADLFECGPINKDGRLEYNRVKTRDKKKDSAFTSIFVIPEALEIIEKYKDPDGIRLLRLYKDFKRKENVQTIVNTGLYRICDESGIPHVCYYTARHSFATIARNDCDVPKDDISLCLTHQSGFKITDTYIKPDFKRIDEVVHKVVSLLY